MEEFEKYPELYYTKWFVMELKKHEYKYNSNTEETIESFTKFFRALIDNGSIPPTLKELQEFFGNKLHFFTALCIMVDLVADDGYKIDKNTPHVFFYAANEYFNFMKNNIYMLNKYINGECSKSERTKLLILSDATIDTIAYDILNMEFLEN